jgi:hypothetical protein
MEVSIMANSSLTRILRFLLLGMLPWMLAALCLPAKEEPAKTPSGDKAVEQLLADLGSERYEVREAATKTLIDLEDEPLALRKFLQSPDAEVRRRVRRILETRLSGKARRGLKRACILAKEGRVDEMVERLIFWKDWNRKEERARTAVELTVRLLEWEHRTFGNTSFLSSSYFRDSSGFGGKIEDAMTPVTPAEIAEIWGRRTRHYLDREIVLEQREVELGRLVALASGKARAPGINSSVLIANESIHMKYGPMNSIIICDEDVEVAGGLSNCLVIARGKVICHKKSDIRGCTFLTGGSVVCPQGVELTGVTMLPLKIPNAPVKFFDPANVGLTIWQLYRGDRPMPDNVILGDGRGHPDFGDGVWIEKIAKDSPFALGLRVHDIVTAVDAEKTPTKEKFRKVLRRKLAEGGPAITFTVRRAGKTLNVPIAVRD